MTQKTKYKQLTELFRDCRKKQIALFLLCSFSIIVNLALVYQIQGLIDCVVDGKSNSEFLNILIRTLILGIVAFISTVVQTRKWHYFRHEVINKMRVKMYQSMMQKDATFFDTTATGDIASGILNDGSSIAESAGISILMLWLNILQILIILGVMVYLNPAIGAFVLVLGIMYYFLVNLVNGEMRNSYMEERQEFANLSQNILEDVKAIYDITVLDKKDFFLKRFSGQVWDKYYKKIGKVINIQVRIYALDTVMKVILPVLVIALGAYYSYQGQITVGTLVIFYTFVGKLIEPLNNLADFYQGSQMALGAAERVYDYLFIEEEEDTEYRDAELHRIESLELKIHSFAWKERKILQQIDEVLLPGDAVFIRGESGSGKTTLLKLICDLYEIEDGEILINGKKITLISEKSLYQAIKILFQEPFVFEGSILDNLTLGDQFEEEYIWEILRTVCLDEFVSENGLDYILYENGKNISGGQKQRLCLARILLRNPQILLLDEATSALDMETEQQLIQNLGDYIQKNKVIMIAVSHSHGFEAICNKRWDLSIIFCQKGARDNNARIYNYK